MTPQPILISLSPEVQELLADNEIDIVEELKKDLPEVSRGSLPDPASLGHSETRDITLVILASAAAFYTVSLGIERIINALGSKPSRITSTRLAPVTDGKGEGMRDKAGQPILQWVEETELLEPKKSFKEEGTWNFSWMGLKVDLQNRREQV